jgi:hypothetical protein
MASFEIKTTGLYRKGAKAQRKRKGNRIEKIDKRPALQRPIVACAISTVR